MHLDFETEAAVAARKFAGTARGHIYVLIQTRLLYEMEGAVKKKAALLLAGFTGYPASGWESHSFGATTVLVHSAP